MRLKRDYSTSIACLTSDLAGELTFMGAHVYHQIHGVALKYLLELPRRRAGGRKALDCHTHAAEHKSPTTDEAPPDSAGYAYLTLLSD